MVKFSEFSIEWCKKYRMIGKFLDELITNLDLIDDILDIQQRSTLFQG